MWNLYRLFGRNFECVDRRAGLTIISVIIIQGQIYFFNGKFPKFVIHIQYGLTETLRESNKKIPNEKICLENISNFF